MTPMSPSAFKYIGLLSAEVSLGRNLNGDLQLPIVAWGSAAQGHPPPPR